MRRLITFPCEGETLVGTLDEATGAVGLLIVSGGNEVRAGAHRGMAILAARLADQNVPVFRFDRRGIGDSSGDNLGYAASQLDIAAAVAVFRREAPMLRQVVGFGNCDGATALALFGRQSGVGRVVLANPWVVEPVDDLPPAAAIRARYIKRAGDPSSWLRVIRGQVSFTKVWRGLRRIVGRAAQNSLATRVLSAIAETGERATVILASGDATAIAYASAAQSAGVQPATIRIDTASHSFTADGDIAAIEHAILQVVTAT